MRTYGQHAFRLTALATALLAAYGPAVADDAAIAELTKPQSFFSIGVGNWSNDRPQEGIYDGMRDGRAYGLLDFDVRRRDDATGTWFTLRGLNLGLDTREVRGEWLRQGNAGIFVEYSRIPRDNPYKFNTALQGLGTTTLVVAGTGAAALPFRDIELGVHRDVVSVGGFKNLLPGLDLKVSFRNDYKEGSRQWGRGGAAEFVYEPIESTTRQIDVALEYTTEKIQLAGGYYGSFYDNAYSLVNTILNQGAATTQYWLSLPLDNQAHQVYFNGGYAFTPTTRATWKVAYTHATQNEHLPTKDVPGLSLASSPGNLNGKLDTTLVQLGLTSRPMPALSLSANFRYHDVSEKTPQARFVQTGTAGTCADTLTCVDNTPLSFETITGKVEAVYRLPMQFNLIGGFEYRDQDRTVPVGDGTINAAGVDRQRYVPFRSDIKESTYRLQLRRSMSETLNGSIAYLHAKRDGSSYSQTNEEESDEINPIHIADRKRDKWRATLDWTPSDAFSLQLNVEDSRDKYEHSDHRPYGLREGSAVLYSVDANYALNDKWQFSAWASYDKSKATQFGQRAQTQTGTPPTVTAAGAEKESHLSDTGTSFGLGMTGRPHDKVSIGADLQWTRNKSKYPETVTTLAAGPVYPANVTGPLPDIENKLTRLKFHGTYALSKNSDLRLDYVYERWQTDDWSWLFSDGSAFTYGTTTDGTRVLTTPKQTSNFVGLRYNYRFR